jgi:Dullard-like phosphatase family protein
VRAAVNALLGAVLSVAGLLTHALSVAAVVVLFPAMLWWRRRGMKLVKVREAEKEKEKPGKLQGVVAAKLRGGGGGSSSRSSALFSSLMVPGFSPALSAAADARNFPSPGPLHSPSLFLQRKTLVLDLDETLVHSQFKLTENCDLRLDVVVDHFPAVFYVAKRPYLDVFLRTAALWFDLVIFTASLQKYAEPLISNIDPDGLIKQRLFRPHCIKQAGNFVKDLTTVEPDLRNVVIIDNSPAAYAMHDSNAIPIEAWYDDQADEELLNLLPLLHAVAFLHDVRSLLSLRMTHGKLVAKSRRTSASAQSSPVRKPSASLGAPSRERL